MGASCREYFTQLVSDANNFELLNSVVEEALYADQATENSELADIISDKLQNMNPDQVYDFLRSFTANWTGLTTEQLNFAIKISEEGEISNLLRIVKQNVEVTGVFDETSRYIMQNIDVNKCLRENAKLYGEIFELLVDAGLDSTVCYKRHTSKVQEIFGYIFRPCTNY